MQELLYEFSRRIAFDEYPDEPDATKILLLNYYEQKMKQISEMKYSTRIEWHWVQELWNKFQIDKKSTYKTWEQLTCRRLKTQVAISTRI